MTYKFLLALTFLCSCLFINDLSGQCCGRAYCYFPTAGCYPYWSLCKGYTIIEFDAGPRRDWLKWNRASPKGTIEVQEKQNWRRLLIAQGMIKAKWVSNQNFFLKTSAAYGRVYRGRHTESTYTGNEDSREEILHYRSHARQGHTQDWSVGGGYNFIFGDNLLFLSPGGGYAFHQQILHSTDSIRTVDALDDLVGPVNHRKTSYTADWIGPWAGMDFAYLLPWKIRLFGGADVFWARFRSKGHVDPGTPTVDPSKETFRQRANGQGLIAHLGLRAPLYCGFLLGVLVEYIDMRTTDGDQEIYTHVTVPGGGRIKVKTEARLNRAKWKSLSASLQLAYAF